MWGKRSLCRGIKLEGAILCWVSRFQQELVSDRDSFTRWVRWDSMGTNHNICRRRDLGGSQMTTIRQIDHGGLCQTSIRTRCLFCCNRLLPSSKAKNGTQEKDSTSQTNRFQVSWEIFYISRNLLKQWVIIKIEVSSGIRSYFWTIRIAPPHTVWFPKESSTCHQTHLRHSQPTYTTTQLLESYRDKKCDSTCRTLTTKSRWDRAHIQTSYQISNCQKFQKIHMIDLCSSRKIRKSRIIE